MTGDKKCDNFLIPNIPGVKIPGLKTEAYKKSFSDSVIQRFSGSVVQWLSGSIDRRWAYLSPLILSPLCEIWFVHMFISSFQTLNFKV